MANSLQRGGTKRKWPLEEPLALPAPPTRRRIEYGGKQGPLALTATSTPPSRRRFLDDTVYELNIFLPRGGHVCLKEEPDDDLQVRELIRMIKRTISKHDMSSVNWGDHVYLEDPAGNRIEDGEIFDSDEPTRTFFLQDGQPNAVHTLQDMWNVTPNPELLGSLPQEYTLETALADLLDNSLQAVWSNAPGERRLISVTLKKDKITVFDSGQGMDSTKRNSIAKWGTMGSSKHRSERASAIGGKPPFLRPFFGMYGFGGLVAAMHLGGVAVVSSKTKASKKVVSLRLEKDKLMERCKADRTWKTPGEYREPTEGEVRKSPHGSFTKVELSKLKSNLWTEEKVMCMLKDIYFPYIQCDEADSSQRTTTPVEFQVNNTNMAEVDGGEVAITNMCSSIGAPFILDIHVKKLGHIPDRYLINDLDRANARITCLYFPIQQGQESIDMILEELQKRNIGVKENFDNFCRVSIRRLGRLLPDARWRRLPFMEPKRKRGDKATISKTCYERVKAFVDTDAGFVPTTSKMDLISGHPFTNMLRNLGTRGNMPEGIKLELRVGKKQLTLQELEKEYEDWIKESHEFFDEEVDCDDQRVTLVTEHVEELGFSQGVFRVYSRLNRKGTSWKQGMRIKLKGLPGQKKDFYATIEHFVADGLSEDKGDTKVICRPMEVPKEEGSRVRVGDSAGFSLGKSVVVPIDFFTLDKCEVLQDREWNRMHEKRALQCPGQIDILDKRTTRSLGFDGGITCTVKAGTKPFHRVYAVVRPALYAHSVSEGKEVNPTDQKYIIKKPMEMRLLWRRSNTSGLRDQEVFEMSVSLIASEKASNVQGVYCFDIDKGDFRKFYTTAGEYELVFSVNDEGIPGGVLEKIVEVRITSSDKVGQWILQYVDGSDHSPAARLGSEIGPLFLKCLDEYGNAQDVRGSEDLRFEVWSDGRQIPVSLLVEGVTQQKESKTALTIKAIKLSEGALEGIAADYSAFLKLVVSNQPASSIHFHVLPGEMDSVKVTESGEIDGCLRKGDIIHTLTLQIMDRFGNHVEKGCKITLRLVNLQLQDSQGHERVVDDDGCLVLGGLLSVTGPFNSTGQICVFSEKKGLLYKREIPLLQRTLQIVSEIPKEYTAGEVLHDIVVQVVDEMGIVDRTMTGSHHVIVLSSSEERVYSLKEGSCCIKMLKLPERPGTWCCHLRHGMYEELQAEIKINVLPHECPTEGLHVLDDTQTENNSTLMMNDKSGTPYNLADVTRNLISRLEELRKRIAKYVGFITRCEQEKEKLNATKILEEKRISEREGELESLQSEAQRLEQGSAICGQDFNGYTAEKVANEISKTILPVKFFLEALCLGAFTSGDTPGNSSVSEILGIVCFLASAKNEAHSQALAEFIGQDSMLAVVCKTHAAASILIRLREEDGMVDDTWGLYGYVRSRKRSVHGKLRVFVLEDLSFYEKGEDNAHPQKLLKMEAPRLSNGKVPEGFIGYAVNLLHLNDEHLDFRLAHGDHCSLRGSLFYNLLKELQVYDTQRNLSRAKDTLTTGGISLDGGLIRERGCQDFGQRVESNVMFPLHSKAGKKIPPLRSINHITQMMEIKDQMKVKEEEIQQSRGKLEEAQERMNFVMRRMETKKAKALMCEEETKSVLRELDILNARCNSISAFS